MLWYVLFFGALAFLWMRSRQRRARDMIQSTEISAALPSAGRRRDFRDLARAEEVDAILNPEGSEEPPSKASSSIGVSESVSAVLRRQIPPRDGPPRSWLGGLPMLPEGVEWPRGVNPEKQDAGPVPLHFIAQICCADLPTDLWGRLGPRDGWLLLFVNGNTCDSEDRGAWKVLHVSELGMERQPPADIGPIHDGMYTGSTEWTLRESVYPRWPVDVVSVPNDLRVEEGRSLAAPENFASILYEGRPVTRGGSTPPKLEPFTWRCLVEALDQMITDLRKPLPEQAGRYKEQMHQKLNEVGAFEGILPALERREAEFWQQNGALLNEPEPSDLDPRERSRRANMRANAGRRAAGIEELAALLAANPTPDDLIERLAQEDAEGWRARTADHLDRCRSSVPAEMLDSAIASEDWETAKGELSDPDREIWALAWGRSEGSGLPVTVERRKQSVMERLGPILSSSSLAVATRYYLDSEKRGLIPLETRAALEADWRQLYENRPHRLGGYHDGLQSDAQPGPVDMLLLMQFATDYPMHWLWGDCGVVYCFIRPSDLEERAWDRAEFHLECH